MKKVILLLLLLLITSCTPKEYGPKIIVKANPEDNLDSFFRGFISNTSTSLDCALYTYHDSYNTLFDKVKNVRIITDKSRTKRTMHMKFCIQDEKRVLFGSFNPHPDQNKLNNLVVFESQIVVSLFENEFEELLGEKKDKKSKKNIFFYNDEKIEIYFCPEDDCENKLLEQLGTAKHEISLYLFSFTLKTVENVLKQKRSKGAVINGCVEDRRIGMSYELYDDIIEYAAVRLDKKETLFHHKMFIVDNQTLITGSMNPTKNGIRGNDEVLAIIHSEAIATEMKQKVQGSCQ